MPGSQKASMKSASAATPGSAATTASACSRGVDPSGTAWAPRKVRSTRRRSGAAASPMSRRSRSSAAAVSP